MLRKRLMLLLGLLIVASMVLAACGPADATETPDATEAPDATEEATEEVVKTTRKGGWLDEIVFLNIATVAEAVTQMQAGEVDVFAFTAADPEVFATVQADPNLEYQFAYGSIDGFILNPEGPEFADGMINPFHFATIREAMNWAIDREYVVQEILGGLGVAKFFPLHTAFPDYAKVAAVAAALETKYAYDFERADTAITAEMEANGAVKEGGMWMYNGEPVTIKALIRVEDERFQIGHYFSDQLEALGFTVDRLEKTSVEASPIWQGDPALGEFHFYTAGWGWGAIDRDQSYAWSWMSTDRAGSIPAYQARNPDPDYDAIALALETSDFTTVQERVDLMKQAMEMGIEDSGVIWVVDTVSYTPYVTGFEAAADLAGGVGGSSLTPYTIRWTGQEGGVVRWSQPGMLINPWNPVDGSNWLYDANPQRATMDHGLLADPFTGLPWPQRIDSATVTHQSDLPTGATQEWMTFERADEITVPADAWYTFDPVNEVWVTVGEEFPDGLTALTKSVVTYPSDMWTTVTYHDGSYISMGDFLMYMIYQFARSVEGSPIYDEATAGSYAAFLRYHKGFRITSTDPLTIETYSDYYGLDAESSITTWWPEYAQGPGAWHNIAIGQLAEIDGALAFSEDKATTLEVEWMSYVSGPSMDILAGYLAQAITDNYIPFAGFMGDYITAEEATTRYANLQTWYDTYGHFWLGAGPYYLYAVYPVEESVLVKHNANYVDLADKWARFSAPMFATVDIDGDATVTVGDTATFDAMVTFNDEAYPSDLIDSVTFLVFDATGALAIEGVADFVDEGMYQATVDTTSLVAGGNKITFVVVSKAIAIPTFESFEFVTTE